MKKIIPFILICFCLCSCAKKEEKAPIIYENPFECTVSASFDSLEFKAKLIFERTQSAMLEIISPKSLSGLKFIYKDGEKKAIFRGLEFALEGKERPFTNAFDIITGAIEKARVSKNRVSDESGKITVSDTTQSGPFSLCIDKNTLAILSLSSPTNNFSARFEDFIKK